LVRWLVSAENQMFFFLKYSIFPFSFAALRITPPGATAHIAPS